MNPLELEMYHQIKTAHIRVSSLILFSLSPFTQSHSMITTRSLAVYTRVSVHAPGQQPSQQIQTFPVSLPYLVVFLKRGYFR